MGSKLLDRGWCSPVILLVSCRSLDVLPDDWQELSRGLDLSTALAQAVFERDFRKENFNSLLKPP